MTEIIQNAITCFIEDFCQKKRGLFLAVKEWENNVHEPRIRDMHKTESTQFKADDDNQFMCAHFCTFLSSRLVNIISYHLKDRSLRVLLFTCCSWHQSTGNSLNQSLNLSIISCKISCARSIQLNNHIFDDKFKAFLLEADTEAFKKKVQPKPVTNL